MSYGYRVTNYTEHNVDGDEYNGKILLDLYMIEAYEDISLYNGLLVGNKPGATFGKYSIMKPVAMTIGHRIDLKKEELDGK